MVIDAKLVKNGGMQVADVGGTFYGAIFRFVGVPVNHLNRPIAFRRAKYVSKC